MPERPDNDLCPQIASVVENVYRTMLGATVSPAAEVDFGIDAPLTAAVHYVGAWKGALVLECSIVQAIRWAERLMPLPPPLSLEDARDGLGELTNMIAGNLKPLLPPGVSLSMPSVIEGADHRLCLLGARHRETFAFADESSSFRITFVRFVGKA